MYLFVPKSFRTIGNEKLGGLNEGKNYNNHVSPEFKDIDVIRK